ncbi:MAG: MFS transporter [Legionella sp.]|nr:MFS transporter [Legionella sp.]
MIYPWSKTVVPIAAIFSFRMLGLFLLIPVFTLYANKLQGATPALIGFALGGYGLTQALLQIPFGLLSDKFGRKSLITVGLILFACGSLYGALTNSIYGMILARILQGGGAIGSVLIALLADLTPDEERTKSMAVIGMTIGISFGLAMVISPALSHRFGLAGIFYFTMIMAISAIVLLHWVIPTPLQERFHADSNTKLSLILSVLKNPQLQGLNLGIFCQHFILTSTFFAIPMILQQQLVVKQGYFYLPLMIFSFIVMIPLIIVAEKKKVMKGIFLASVLVIAFTQAILALYYAHWLLLCLMMFGYFAAFNFLEACLPSLISRQASSNSKGTAMGVYSTGQFLGIFFGGVVAGLLYQWAGNQAIFIANTLVAVLWFIMAISMSPNIYFSTLILHYAPNNQTDAEVIAAFLKIPGIKEVAISKNEQVLYLRLDKERYQIGRAEELLAQLRT